MTRSIPLRKEIVAVAFAVATGAWALAALQPAARADDGAARAILRDAAGEPVGSVQFIQQQGRVLVKVAAAFPPSVAAGFHGFHVHANADPANGTGCVGPSFTSADGHYNPTGAAHGAHAGDLPVLFVSGDGAADARFTTDRFSVQEVLGRAAIVHAAPDNFANVPSSRTYANPPATHEAYHSHDPVANPGQTAAGPDRATLATGDAGPRSACGVIAATS